MTSYQRSIVTIGLSRTVTEINGDVRRKSHDNRQFSHPRVFNAPLKGFQVEFRIGAGVLRIENDGAFSRRKSFEIDLTVLIQYRSVTAATQPASQPDTLP